MKTIRIWRTLTREEFDERKKKAKVFSSEDEILAKIREVVPDARFSEWSMETTPDGEFIKYKGKQYTTEEALKSNEIPADVKEEIRENLEHLHGYTAITPPRQQFEDCELHPIDIKVNDEAYYELLTLFALLEIRMNPIDEGVEITYYDERSFEAWKKDMGYK